MALASTITWEVRTTGSDNNGGGFKDGATGTDWSQQNAAQATLTVASTVNAVTTIIDVAAGDYTVAATDVGNVLQITGGTATAGFYEITARSGQQWTLDRSAGAAGQTVVGAMGGALATVGKATATMVAQNTVYVKAGTYNISAAITTVAGGAGSFANNIIGYNVTRTDRPTGASRPKIATNGNGINAIDISTQAWHLYHLIFDGTGGTRGLIGVNVSVSNSHCRLHNVRVTNFSTRGIAANSNMRITNCEVDTCAQGIQNTNGNCDIYDSNIHDNTGIGWDSNNSAWVSLVRCLITNNTGGTSDGIVIDTQTSVSHCVVYGNGRDGVQATVGYPSLSTVRNCIITNNARYGINFTAPAISGVKYEEYNYNAFFSNTSGAVNGFSSGPNDVTLTASPYVNVAGNDFSLNTTAGGGAACRAAGSLGAFPGGSTTGYIDIGAAQHQDPAGGGGGNAVAIFGG